MPKPKKPAKLKPRVTIANFRIKPARFVEMKPVPRKPNLRGGT